MEAEQIRKEKEYLNKVKRVLLDIIRETTNRLNNSKENIGEMKKFIWDNLSDFTDEERVIAMNDIDKDVNITNKGIERLSKYEKSLENPYFGKVVFYDEEFDETQQVYIGIASVQKGLNFYVFDWRAPVSSLFYNFELGKAFYESPSGIINGEITSKMQFKIENGELVRCFNCDINIDDDYLQEILASSSSDKMKNIVSTIQREQNEIIRNSKDRYLIVQGIAGSGKTSVAMHRIAYLLYKDKTLTSKNVLIFSPTDVFSDYISNVLPELGEENVLTSTFSEFAKTFLKCGKKIESYTDFLEKVYTSTYSKETEYKLSKECYEELKEFIKHYYNDVTFKSAIESGGRSVKPEELKELFTEKYKSFPVKERLSLMAEKVCYNLKIPQKNKNRIINALKESCGLNLDTLAVYNMFLESKSMKLYSEKPSVINYEDITGLLYTYFELEGYPYYPHIKHVVIDEAQDYTLFQMEMFKKMFRNSSFTILGDKNQAINIYSKINDLSALSEVFDGAKYLELSKTYRSSEEIIDYSNEILSIKNACAIRHSNSMPVDIYSVSDDKLSSEIEASIDGMIQSGFKKIAIIAKNRDEARKIYCHLSGNKYQLIEREDANITSDIIIIPSYLSKGLEFDGVIVCNLTNDEYTTKEKNLYYVVCTRPQHKLTIYNEPQKLMKRI